MAQISQKGHFKTGFGIPVSSIYIRPSWTSGSHPNALCSVLPVGGNLKGRPFFEAVAFDPQTITVSIFYGIFCQDYLKITIFR